MLDCARTLPKPSRLSTFEHLPQFVWHSIHTPAVAVSKEHHTLLRYA